MTDRAPTPNTHLLERDSVDISIVDSNDDFIDLGIKIEAKVIKRISKRLRKDGVVLKDPQLIAAIIKECMAIAMEEHGDQSVWGPHLHGSTPVIKEGTPFEITLYLDRKGDVQWPSWSDITIKRPVREIDQNILDAEMHQQCLMAGERHPREGTPRPDDIISCNLQVILADSAEPPLRLDGLEIQIPPTGQPTLISGIPVPNFESHLPDIAPGQTLEIDINAPEGHSLHGQRAVLKIECDRIEQITPASVDKVVEMYGSPNEEVLRTQIRYAMEAKNNRDQLLTMADQLFDAVEQKIDFRVPLHVIQGRRNKLAKNLLEKARAAGHSTDEIKRQIEQMQEEWDRDSNALACRDGIINLLAKHLKINADEALINKEINLMAVDLGRRPEDFRKEVIAQGKMPRIVINCKKQRCLQFLKGKVVIEDIPADEWESMQEADQA